MRYTRRILVALTAIVCGCAHTGQGAPESLLRFVPPAYRLPEGLAPGPLPDAAETPVPLTNNPMTSSDRELTAWFCEMMFEDAVRPEAVTEVMLAVYRESEELGIVAFRFSSPREAKEALESLRLSEDRLFRTVKANVVVCVWNDGASESAFQFLKDYVTEAAR